MLALASQRRHQATTGRPVPESFSGTAGIFPMWRKGQRSVRAADFRSVSDWTRMSGNLFRYLQGHRGNTTTPMYRIKFGYSFGVVTSRGSHQTAMIRTVTGRNREEQVQHLRQLCHPNIVAILEIYACPDEDFLISEFMPTTLLHICRSPLYPSEAQLSSIFYQVYALATIIWPGAASKVTPRDIYMSPVKPGVSVHWLTKSHHRPGAPKSPSRPETLSKSEWDSARCSEYFSTTAGATT